MAIGPSDVPTTTIVRSSTLHMHMRIIVINNNKLDVMLVGCPGRRGLCITFDFILDQTKSMIQKLDEICLFVN